jgi:hypothetical protein
MRWLEHRRQLRLSRQETDKDITTFGEELRLLDAEVVDRSLDEATRQDYQHALDAYDDAKLSLAAVKHAEDIRSVTQILEDGRYAIACVRARLAGQPLPTRRPPCFFNPAHGPSTEDVDWAPAGGAVRSVPACAADAERIRAGAEPAIRTILDGSRRLPYWQAGPAYSPWAQGYYSAWSGGDLLTGILLGSALDDLDGWGGTSEAVGADGGDGSFFGGDDSLG